jgi:hypothetical protein
LFHLYHKSKKRKASSFSPESRKRARIEKKLDCKSGALIAPSRSGEGWPLPIDGESCLPDAIYNGLMMLGFNASLRKLRRFSMPALGNNRSASWSSMINSLNYLEYPFKLNEVTASFRVKGGPMLNLLRAPSGVYIVSLSIEVDGLLNKHSVMLSTIQEPGKLHGKIIDNSRLCPVYLEGKDKKDKGSAYEAWRKVFEQNTMLAGWSILRIFVDTVYKLDNR